MYFIVGYLFLSRIKLVLHFAVNTIGMPYLLFLFILSKFKISLTFCCQHSRKSVAEKNDICYLNVYAEYEQNRWLRDTAKQNHFFMKPINLISLRRMSRVKLAGFLSSKLTIFQSKLNVLQGQRIHTLLCHPYSALSLIDSLPVLSEGHYAHAAQNTWH